MSQSLHQNALAHVEGLEALREAVATLHLYSDYLTRPQLREFLKELDIAVNQVRKPSAIEVWTEGLINHVAHVAPVNLKGK